MEERERWGAGGYCQTRMGYGTQECILLPIPGRIVLGYITGVHTAKSANAHGKHVALHWLATQHHLSSINNNSYKGSNWLQQTPYYRRLPAAGVAVYDHAC